MTININERIGHGFAKEHFPEYEKKIEEILKKFIFLKDKSIIHLIVGIIEKDENFLQQFSERNQEDKEKMSYIIAKTLLNMYRESLRVVQKSNTIDWKREYETALALYCDEKIARDIVLNRIINEKNTNVFIAVQILEEALGKIQE